MYEPTPNLPPKLAKWLASGDPTLVAKAHAALQAAEPDTNDLLLTKIEAERSSLMFRYVITLCLAFYPFQIATHFGQVLTVSRICLGLLVTLPCFYGAFRWLLTQPVNRFHALILALAQRSDLRATPLLLQLWQPGTRGGRDDQLKIEGALLTLLQTALIGETPFSIEPKAQDPAANLRVKFDALTRKRKGTVCFAPAATATPRRVQLWLTLLPHLATDTHPKSRAVLQRIADARAQTLQEELIQNDARALLAENALPATKTDNALPPHQQAAQTRTQASTDETPAQIQRVGRS